MEKINQYVSLVNQAFAVAKEKFNNPESLKKAEADKETLVNSLEKDFLLRFLSLVISMLVRVL